MKLILSTLTSPQELVFTQTRPNGSLVVAKRIRINGGANVADRKTLVTPSGVITELSDEDFKLVTESDWFKRQEKGGYVRPVESASDAEDPEKKGMKSKDNSAQKTKKDYSRNGVRVNTGKPSDDAE